MPSQDEDVGDQACMVSGIVKLEDDGPRQPKLAVYCPKTYQNEVRDFQQVCYEKFIWLSYDISSSTASCYPCEKFMNDSHFKFTNWKKSDTFREKAGRQTQFF